MAYQRYYAGLIWTNHALIRLQERGVHQVTASKTFHQPDVFFAGKEEGTTEYRKRFGRSVVTLIAKPNTKKEWLILSCWIDPPMPGTKDAKKKELYRTYLSASFGKKFWMNVLKQFGIISF